MLDKQLFKYIKESGYLQKFIADNIGMNPTQLSMTLSGRRKLSLDYYWKLIHFFGITEDDLRKL